MAAWVSPKKRLLVDERAWHRATCYFIPSWKPVTTPWDSTIFTQLVESTHTVDPSNLLSYPRPFGATLGLHLGQDQR